MNARDRAELAFQAITMLAEEGELTPDRLAQAVERQSIDGTDKDRRLVLAELTRLAGERGISVPSPYEVHEFPWALAGALVLPLWLLIVWLVLYVV